MDVPCALAPTIEAPFTDGLRGLGITPTDEEPPVVVAGPIDDRPSVDLASDAPWIDVELGGMGQYPVEGIEGSIAIVHPTGPCPRCLAHRVRATEPTEGDTEIDDGTARYAGALVGRLLNQTGDALEAAVGRVDRLDGTRHELLAVPNCRCDTDTTVSRATADPETALDRAERAVDPAVGIVTRVGEQASYPAPYYVAELADTESFSDAQAARHAAGVDLDWNDAFMRAIGEALERYCAGVYRTSQLPETAPEPVALERFPTAEAEATPLGRWWPATVLHTGDDVQLPMETVVFPPPDDAAIDAITTGLGLGSSWTEAVLAGVLEVIERDACMLGWYSTFEPLELEVERETYATIRRHLAGEGLASTALLMTQDVDVPVVTAVVHRRDGDGRPIHEIPGVDADDWPAFAVGSAAALDAEVAAERALSEAAQNWVELAQLGPEAAEDEGNIATFASYPRSARSILDVDTAVSAATIGPEDIDDAAAALDHCVDALEAVGLRAYAARTTTRDVASLGFEGARVVVPDAQPLVHRREHQTDRLRTAVRELGFQPRLDRGPHPYP